MKSNEKLVSIYQAMGEAEAHIIKGLLESNGIPCFLQSPVLSQFGSVGFFNVMVRESDTDEAKKLIAGENDV